MANEEFFNFEEALDQLRLKEEELKRLVSEGEIRAFREGDTMRLRRSDVEHLKRELMGGDVVELSGDDELVFEDDVELGEAGMATEEIANMDTLLDDDVEDVGEIDLEQEAAPRAAGVAAVSSAQLAAARRTVQEQATEGLGLRAALVVTTVLLVLGLPVVVSISKDQPGSFARMIAGLFGQDL